MELTEKQIAEKYADIEDKIPSVWPDYEAAGIALAQDLCMTWDVTNPELIRVIALLSIRNANSPYAHCGKHVKRGYERYGLYPFKVKSLKIKPDASKIHT